MSAKRFVWGWEQKDLNKGSVRKKDRILVIIFCCAVSQAGHLKGLHQRSFVAHVLHIH